MTNNMYPSFHHIISQSYEKNFTRELFNKHTFTSTHNDYIWVKLLDSCQEISEKSSFIWHHFNVLVLKSEKIIKNETKMLLNSFGLYKISLLVFCSLNQFFSVRRRKEFLFKCINVAKLNIVVGMSYDINLCWSTFSFLH